MSKTPLISLQDVCVSYGSKSVLRAVNLCLHERDFLGIIGPNGGGKTTLVKTILGLKKADSGRITFFRDGHPVPAIAMGYLPQYSRIDKRFPISVYEVILSGLNREKRLWQRFRPEQHERVRDMIGRMGLAGLEQCPVGALSGGQLQRALLGRAVISRPDVVILDEPNTYLDRHSESRLYALLEEINRRSAIILVSHDIGAVLQNVRAIACVNETLDYHPDTELPPDWLEEHFGCPIDLVGHGQLPHRILKCHAHPANAPEHPIKSTEALPQTKINS